MNEVNSPNSARVADLLSATASGDPDAAARLLPILYDELRRLAQSLLAKAPPGNTLQPTALVHEAYMRLIGPDGDPGWNSRGHFFGAAALAMRRILVEQARRKGRLKHGGELRRVDLDQVEPEIASPTVDILALDEALTRLSTEEPLRAQIVMLRFFAGLDREETAAALDMSPRTLDREWKCIVARLHRELSQETAGE